MTFKIVLFVMTVLLSSALTATDNVTQKNLTIDNKLAEIEQLALSDLEQSKKLILATKALLAQKSTPAQLATFNNLTAYTHLLSREYEQAYKYLSLSQKYALEANNVYAQAESKRLKGVLYSLTNLPEESLPLFLEALALHKQLGSKKEFHTLQGISLYYRNQHDFNKYLEYGRLLIEHPLVKSGPQYKGTAEYTIGEGLLKLGQYEEARPHLINSIRILNSMSSTWVSEAYISLAELELLTGNTQQAIDILNTSTAMATKNSYFAAQLKAELLRAKVHQTIGNNTKAIAILQALLPTARLHKDQAAERQAEQMFASLLEQQGDYKAALQHQIAFKNISDNINQKNQQSKSTFLRARLDLEHQEQQIKLLKQQQEQQAFQQAQKQRTSQLRDIALGLFIVLVLFMVYYLIKAHKVKRKMQQLALEAETANKAKSNFLAKMSHEIRTPMNAIIGLSQLSLKDALSDKQRENISMVHASSQSLLTLLNDLLDFSKIEAHKLELEQADFSLSDSIDRLLNVCHFSAQEKQLKLNIVIDSDVPDAFNGDALRLEQVLINLVNNAIKFTEQGDIALHISLLEQQGSVSRLSFAVTDHGIGIAEEQLDKLFQAFSQSDNSITRRYGGTGLGLVICKEIVELMSGSIHVTSELGKGSCFSFNVVLSSGSDVNSSLMNPAVVSLPAFKILIVDDSKSSRALLSDMLNKFNLEVEQAQGGLEALEILKQAVTEQAPFDVVLMDWRMPGLDGFESIRIINQVITDNLPHFILISSFDKSDAADLSRTTPVADILEKPVKPTQLIASLAKLEKATSAPTLPKPTIENNDSNSAHLNLLLAEDNLINQRVIQGFLEDLNVTIDCVNNGLEAVKAVQKQHYDLVLMDVQMPQMDGLEATQMIRQKFNNDTPIIAMTAHSTKEDEEKSLNAGMNMHLTKPVDSKALIALVHDLMEKKAMANTSV
ncbi:response regulator [Psychrobium sp. 1_MG-2023]|uniref:hybrid sensor histidine kinase/response regulator n=1 Tax=Psychrobium sp. 1_MG-2023 TaxID=3062624 RepID=UPI002735FF77|nr:response regulator [Psychrobium sp. 1_MG-2023]MDP2562303.1 response regulator [Psychrobium sp. 1_MG-2023]